MPFNSHRLGIVDILPHCGWSDDETYSKSVGFVCRNIIGSRTCSRGREGDQEREDCSSHFELLAYFLSCNVYEKKISSIKSWNWIEAEVGQLRRRIENLGGPWMFYKFHITRNPPPIAQHLSNFILSFSEPGYSWCFNASCLMLRYLGEYEKQPAGPYSSTTQAESVVYQGYYLLFPKVWKL